MRAFRPSRFGMLEEQGLVDPAEEVVRIAQIEVYARRAEAHQPLFQENVEPHLESRARMSGSPRK
jgi:hypothetical protein